MAVRLPHAPLRRPLTLALAGLLIPAAAFAQNQSGSQDDGSKPTDLDKIVVTGSLIPQTAIETFVPVTVIKAADIQARGFSNIAEVLQKSSFATGGVQNNQSSASFTQGAETLSLFGLSTSYVKYLIDGRPMANYPALYNGSDVINNLSGIPVELVERIEILPGGQSSLYGSDAIAGVVNIILKKDVDGSVLSGRIGGYDEGGGKSGRLSFATSVSNADGRWHTLLGLQAEKADPVWASQRDLTRRFNQNGYNGEAAIASRDWLVYDEVNKSYIFPDASNCANVGAAFSGTIGKQTRPGSGDYCGSFFTPGYRTLKNEKESAQLYAHSTFDLSDNTQLYADVLLNRDRSSFHSGAGYLYWDTAAWGRIYDQNLGTLVTLQRSFAPEEMGNWEAGMSESKARSYAISAGITGTLGQDSYWDYDISLTRTEYRLTESKLARLAAPIDAYFEQHVLGAQLGTTADGFAIYAPNYAEFYKLLSPADFYGFMDTTKNRSNTYDNMLRAQLTNGSLFQLPGGYAGMAIALEASAQGWNYAPDARLMNGAIWGDSAVNGEGDRTRYAVTTEVRLPLLESLTVSASGRYDSYRVAGQTVSKPTYSLGLEYRPIETLLLRGKYGTAFKAPTLAEQFQGTSGFYGSTVDYYNCALQGHSASDIANCPMIYREAQYSGEQTGNPSLLPINATVWSYGMVWAPTPKLSFNADYHHWDIRNEVSLQDVDQLMRNESFCRQGVLDANSGTCHAAYTQITRLADGSLQKIRLNKVNVAKERLDALTLGANYELDLGTFGLMNLSGAWTRNFEHQIQRYPTDPVIDALSDPYNSTDAKYKATASATWSKSRWTSTLYANYLGPTPNYRASIDPIGYALAGSGRLGSYTTFNGSVGFNASPALKLSLVVNNIGNRMPTMDTNSYEGTSGAPYNSANFDTLGRAYYLEATWSFGKK